MAEHPDITTRLPGLRRRKDGVLAGAPESFTVIGLDIAPDKLKGRYRGTPHEGRACEIIDAIVQVQRIAKAPPAHFIDACRCGVVEPILIADLWEDRTGKTWAPLVDGRQRNVSVRAINAEKGPQLEIPALVKTFKKASPGLDAAIVKNVANCRVPRTPSQRAEDAADLDTRGLARGTMLALVEARDEAELEQLLALAACCNTVKDAVDGGKVPMGACVDLAKHDFAEQARRVAGRLAGNGKGAKDAAREPRAKTKPAPVLASWEATVRQSITIADTEDSAIMRAYADGLASAQGKAPPPWALRYHEASDAERLAANGGGKPRKGRKAAKGGPS